VAYIEEAADIGAITDRLIDSIQYMDHVGKVTADHRNPDGWYDGYKELNG
jgi:hypothetical protein